MLNEKLRLYLITNRNNKISNNKFLDIIEQSILGGVTAVQLREKDLEFDKFVRLAKQCQEITAKYNVPLFINDNIYVAKQVNSEGLHIGQKDISLKYARAILGKGYILGISINSLEQLSSKLHEYVDYLSIGPIFHTRTKLDITSPLGLKKLLLMMRKKQKPTIVIGGISLHNINTVMMEGIDGVAISSAIFNSCNPKRQAQRFKEIIKVITKNEL